MASANKMERRSSTSCLFSELDRGNKGKVTKEDILHFLGDKEQIDEVFKVLDADGDGVISPEDFETGFVEYVQKGKDLSGVRDTESESSLSSSLTGSTREEHFEYDPEQGSIVPEFASALDTFEDGKLKLLDIWKRLGETKPELREDFERFVCEIGDHVAGAKVAVKKYQEETDRKVRALDQEFEEAILDTERRVRSQSFHSLLAKETHFKKQLSRKSVEMESMRKEIVEMQTNAKSHKALKNKMNKLEKDKKELEEIMKEREETESDSGGGNGRKNGNGNGKHQPQTGVIVMASLPPGVEAAVGQGATKFKHDFKYSRDNWNRTNVSSPKAKRRSRSPEDGSSGSSREDTPPNMRRGSVTPLASALGDDIQYWAENDRRQSSPEVTTLTSPPMSTVPTTESTHPHMTEATRSHTDPTTGTLTSSVTMSSETYTVGDRSVRESSPVIHIDSFESTDQGYPPSGRGSTSSTTTGKGTSFEISYDGHGSPGISPSLSRRSTLEKRRKQEDNAMQSPSRARSSSLSHRTNSFKKKTHQNLSPSHSRDPHGVTRSGTPSRGEVYPRVEFVENPTRTPEYSFKLLIIGNSGVGKSAFLIRLTENMFTPSYSLTIGVDFRSVYSEVDSKLVSMKIWDTAGQERFKAVSRSYYHGADGIILMYDITQEHTFLAIREWIDSIKETTGAMPPSVLLLGNKLDRIETASDRGVSHEAGETMAKIFGAHFVEVSAKTGQNVADSYYAMIRLLIQSEMDPQSRAQRGRDTVHEAIALKQAQTTSSSSCCSRR